MEPVGVLSQTASPFISWMKNGPSHFGSNLADQLVSWELLYRSSWSPIRNGLEVSLLFLSWSAFCWSCALLIKSAASCLIICNFSTWAIVYSHTRFSQESSDSFRSSETAGFLGILPCKISNAENFVLSDRRVRIANSALLRY